MDIKAMLIVLPDGEQTLISIMLLVQKPGKIGDKMSLALVSFGTQVVR